mgnify:FL=1|tara:strand:+ start:5315 stop:6028 length:714 start_codon:yes stop_codon:yes gene_type:complete
MKIIGHRGIVSFSPENSLSGLNYVKPLKLNWIESDVILTKDNIPVIFHDKTLDKLTNYNGEMKKFNYNQLKTIDIGYKYSLSFMGEKLPLLSEYIDKCDKLYINIFLELKNYYNDEYVLVKNVIEIIKNCKNIIIILSSYSRKIIELINQLYPTIKKSLIVDKIPIDWYDYVKTNNCYSINISYDILKTNNLIDIQECVSKISTYCHVVNNYYDYKDLQSIGVKGIITDKAEYFGQY